MYRSHAPRRVRAANAGVGQRDDVRTQAQPVQRGDHLLGDLAVVGARLVDQHLEVQPRSAAGQLRNPPRRAGQGRTRLGRPLAAVGAVGRLAADVDRVGVDRRHHPLAGADAAEAGARHRQRQRVAEVAAVLDRLVRAAKADEDHHRGRALDLVGGELGLVTGKGDGAAQRQVRQPAFVAARLLVGILVPVELDGVEVRASGEVAIERAQHHPPGAAIDHAQSKRPRADGPIAGRRSTAGRDRRLRRRQQLRQLGGVATQVDDQLPFARAHAANRRQQPTGLAVASEPLQAGGDVGRGQRRAVVEGHP